MPLYKFLHSLLTALVQSANKMGLQTKLQLERSTTNTGQYIRNRVTSIQALVLAMTTAGRGWKEDQLPEDRDKVRFRFAQCHR
jgi:hypothetical protein